MKKDPETKEDADRVFRGGGWLSDPWYVRVAVCNRYAPGGRRGSLGLRLARTSEPVSIERRFDEEGS